MGGANFGLVETSYDKKYYIMIDNNTYIRIVNSLIFVVHIKKLFFFNSPQSTTRTFSTEDLNAEMQHLEGLMKDLNAITASELESN